MLVRAPFFRDRSLFINPEAMLAADPTTPGGSAVQVAAEEYITPTASKPPSEQSYPGEPPQAPVQDVQFPPTPPNTPKATRSTSEPSMSLSGSRFRKLAITWREDPSSPIGQAANPSFPSAGPPLSPSTQEEMGSTIKAELAPLLLSCSSNRSSQPSDPLETLECFPGTALATFSSHELARRAIKVLRQSERLNARPVVDEMEVPESTKKGSRVVVEGKKRAGKKGAGAGAGGGRTVSAPAATETVGSVTGNDKTTMLPAEATRTTTTTTAARKTPAVLIVNGSWKI